MTLAKLKVDDGPCRTIFLALQVPHSTAPQPFSGGVVRGTTGRPQDSYDVRERVSDLDRCTLERRWSHGMCLTAFRLLWVNEITARVGLGGQAYDYSRTKHRNVIGRRTQTRSDTVDQRASASV